MSATDYRATALLTEHFGFPPLALIDDVINAVNDIMYKCTQAMETYLNERQQKRLEETMKEKNSDEEVVMEGPEDTRSAIPEDEIQLGTAKLETLLESQVDKNFDKFELYALRNIFTVPSDLVRDGWVRLMHHEGIEYQKDGDSQKLDEEIEKLIKFINMELSLRKILKLQITKANKLVRMLRLFRLCLSFLDHDNNGEKLTAEARLAIKSLSPLDENLYFLLSQVDDLITQVLKMHNKFKNGVSQGGINDMAFTPSVRDRYIQGKSFKLLESIGVLEPDHLQNSQSDILHITDFTSGSDIENVKQINETLQSVRLPEPQPQPSSG